MKTMRSTIGIIFVMMVILSSMEGVYSYMYNNMDTCGDQCSSAARSRECNCRSYTIAFTLIGPWSFMNATTGEPYGPLVDIVRKVCDIAGKMCQFAAVGRAPCFDGQFSNVLDGRWYDSCAALAITADRAAKYDFIKPGISDLGQGAIWIRPGSNITLADLRMPHDFVLGYFQEDAVLDALLDSYFEEGYFVKDKNIIRADGDMDTMIAQLTAGLECGLGGIVLDYVLVPPAFFPPGNFTFIGELDFTFGEVHIMVRKDEQCLIKWFSEAYIEFICSDEYPDFCQALTESVDHRTDFCQDRNEICS